MLVYRLDHLNVIPVNQASSGQAYGGTLVVPPGHYYFVGNPELGSWDLTTPGLYCFFVPLPAPGVVQGGNYIVAGGGVDPLPLVSAACWLSVYGDYDTGQTNDWLLNQCRFRNVAMQCGDIVYFTQALLAKAGAFQSRVVHLITAGALNGYSDGHIALEVKDASGRWLFCDVCFDRRWIDTDGNPLSALGWINTPAPVEVALAERQHAFLPYKVGQTTGPHTAIFFQTTTLSQFTARIFQCFGIDDPDGHLYWTVPPGATLPNEVPSNSVVLSRNDWIARFYP